MITKTILPVFDPITLEKIDSKPRDVVHSKGLWHKGIQAHIIRSNDCGDFDIFVQQRSGSVDLSRLKWDQSLASQMNIEDNLEEEKTLRRGLKQELKINKFQAIRLPLDLRIIKKYAQHPNVVNKEIITLFLVKSDQDPNFDHCDKIHQGHWSSWGGAC